MKDTNQQVASSYIIIVEIQLASRTFSFSDRRKVVSLSRQSSTRYRQAGRPEIKPFWDDLEIAPAKKDEKKKKHEDNTHCPADMRLTTTKASRAAVDAFAVTKLAATAAAAAAAAAVCGQH